MVEHAQVVARDELRNHATQRRLRHPCCVGCPRSTQKTGAPSTSGFAGWTRRHRPLRASRRCRWKWCGRSCRLLGRMLRSACRTSTAGFGAPQRVLLRMYDAWKARGLELKSSMEMSSNEAIRQAVQAGLGLGILSLQTLELELALKRLAVLKAEGFPIMRHWYVVHRTDKRLSPAAQAFKKFVLAGNRGGRRRPGRYGTP
ncbi:MAG: LysR substrate-binding domain-containing protein [Thiobacillus sp.]